MSVVVVGAGAAGLAAAAALHRAGIDVQVLEARDRIGGRAWTLRHAGAAVPIELGAEFVHGAAPITGRLAAESGALLCDIEGDHFQASNGRIARVDGFWEKVGRVLRRLDPEREPDRSFAEFLRTKPGGRSLARERTLARSFVQGFHAADPELASERALAAAGNPGEDPDAARHGRLVHGYGPLLEHLAAPVLDRIRFGVTVQEIRWRRGAVQVQTASDVVPADAAIISLPLGVLQAAAEQGGVRIEPWPRAHAHALAHLATGSVARVTLVFRERFWEGDAIPAAPGGGLTRMAFVHTPHAPYNVWWTAHPLRAPVITGWSGGPRARELLRSGAIEDTALAALAAHLGVPRRRLQSLLVASFTHDWDGDPFSRGAYSYARVNGADAARQLARPLERTVLIAGEATAENDSGTVEGALASGERAARQLLRSLR